MLTFAAPSDFAQTRDFDFSDYTLRCGATGDEPNSSVFADAQHAKHCSETRYWPSELLDTFILKMAATGRCVNTAMMLGDQHYAMVQLGIARGSGSAALVALSARLQTYFEAEAPEACVVAAALSQETDARFLMV